MTIETAPRDDTTPNALGAVLAPVRWVRANLFNSWLNTGLTLLIVWALVSLIPALFQWAWSDAVFGPANSEACRAVDGACWAFIHEKYRLILFGTYPYDEQWRPLLAAARISSMTRLTCIAE